MKCSIAVILVTLLTLGAVGDAEAQDPVFSQFYSAPLQLNPALTGIAYGANFSINYRNQWPSLNNAYQTYALSYDQFFRSFNSGVGLYLQSDNAGNGIIRTNKAAATYSYKVRLNQTWEMRLGVEAGMLQTRLDWSKLVFLDQIDPEFGPISPGGTPYPSEEEVPDDLNQTYLDLGVGGLVYSDKFYLGLTIKHLNTPGQSYLNVNENLTEGLPIRWSIHTGAEFVLNPNNKRKPRSFLSPGIMFVSQADSWQINAGTFLGFGEFFGGLWYRHASKNPDAIIGAVGFRTGQFRIIYSYDATISALSLDSGGSHEVGINYTLEDKKRESKYNDCFSLFR